MGAKVYPLMLAAISLSGCADGLRRFAPPGIVKYEELAGDETVDPAIAARIEERRAADGGGFPPLAKQPTKVPDGIAKPERAAMEAALLAERDALNQAVLGDRALAATERIDALEATRDALAEEVVRDDALARRERGLPPRNAD